MSTAQVFHFVKSSTHGMIRTASALLYSKQCVISGGAGKASTSAKASQAVQGRRLDWVRPAKDVVSVAGELHHPLLHAICHVRLFLLTFLYFA